MARTVNKFHHGKWSEQLDSLTDEEPLQITLDGCPVAVVMRTRGDDRDLVYGFLTTEGILQSVGQVARLDLEQKENHALVFLKDDVAVDVSHFQRNLYSASSCGICGKASIEAIRLDKDPLAAKLQPRPEVLLAAPGLLRQAQAVFDRTGGIHAAAIFSATGELLVAREDVGRHNAVDKVVGWALQNNEPLGQTFLQVSGRVSFEVVQKALVAGISCVSAISAPSSLAVDFAEEMNMSLYGFVRDQGFNQYH